MNRRGSHLGWWLAAGAVLLLLMMANGWVYHAVGASPVLDKDKVFHLLVGLGLAYVFYFLLEQKFEETPPLPPLLLGRSSAAQPQ